MSDAPPPKVKIDPNSPVFDTVDAAADARSRDFSSNPNEQIAVVVRRPDGKYVYSGTAPGRNDSSSLTALLPKGHTLAGIVHSHPGQEQSAGVFSPGDIATAGALKLPSYVRFGHDNSIRKFVPDKTKTTILAGADPEQGVLRVSYGDPLDLPQTAAPPAPTQPPADQGQSVSVQAQKLTQPLTEVTVTAHELTSAAQDTGAAWLASFGPDTPPPGKPAPVNQQPLSRADAELIETISPKEAKLREQTGSTASGAKAPPVAMVDTQGAGGSTPSQSPGGTGNAWLDRFGPDYPPEGAPPAPAPPARSPSYLSSFLQGAKGVAEQGRQLLALAGYSLMPWGAAASEGGDTEAQEDLHADPTQQAQKDAYFQHVVDPATRAVQEAELPPDATFGEKLSHGLGATTAMIAEAIVTGGGSLEVAPAETAVGRVAQRAATGAVAMSAPAAQNAVEIGRRVLDVTGDKKAAVIAGVASYATTAAQGAVPMGLGGKILTRMSTGAGIGAAAGEANRLVSNAAMPDSMQQPFDIKEDALNAITGSLFGALPAHESASPRSLADRRAKFDVQEQLTTMMEHAQAAAADTVARQGGDNLSQVVAATHVNAELGAHFDAGAYEGHIATRHAQVAEEEEANRAQAADDARTAAFAQFQNSPAGRAAAVSPDEAFAARERQQAQQKDQDFTAAINQRADQTVERAADEAETAQAGAEKGGATEPAPTIADTLPPDTLQALQSLKERRAAELAKPSPDNSPAGVTARIKATTPPGEGFVPLPPNARGTEPAPTPANRLAAIRQAAEKRAAQATEKPQELSTPEAVQPPAENSTARPPASLATRRAETAATPEAIFDRLAAARPREVSGLVAKLSPAEAAEHLGRLDDSDIENAPLRDALQQRAKPAGEPASETASMVSLARRRADAEAGAAEEGRWQKLMTATPEEAEQIANGMAPEEAQKHLDRLDAAPGDNAVARKALETRVAESAPTDSPTAAEIKEAARASAYHPDSGLKTPTEAQYRAGNYAKGHIQYKGMDVSIEHPSGTERPLGGGATRTMPADYGYIRGSEAADGQHVDILIGKHPESDQHFIVDHLDRSGQYEQSKVLSGFNNRIEAMRAYKKMYPDHPTPPVSEVRTPELKQWLEHGDTTKPYDQKAVNRLGDNRVRLSTAAEKPTHPEDVEHQATSLGDGRIRHEYSYKGGNLHAVEDPRAGVTRVQLADAGPPSVRGRGIGTSMLERAIADAHDRGQRFESDTRVSGPQQGTYSSLKDRGYDVRENPATVDRGTGERVSKSPLRGAYEVRSRPADLAARRAQATDHVTADAERAQPLTRLEAARTLKPLMDHLNSEGRVGGGVELHQDASTLPDNIQAAMKSGSHDEIRGAYDPDSDTIHLVASAHDSHADLLRTAVHEIAHKGLSHLFESDAEYMKTMGDVYRGATDRAWLKDYADQHGIDTRTASGRALLADEYAAHLAENAEKDPGLWQRIVDGVRAGLRKLGVVRDWTDDDIRALVRRATSKLIAHDSDAARAFKEKGIRFADKDEPLNVPDAHPLAIADRFGRVVDAQAQSNPGFLRSRADFGNTKEEQANYKPGAVQAMRDKLADAAESIGDHRLAFIGLRNLPDFMDKKLMPSLREFVRTHDRMEGRRGQLMEASADTAKEWSRYVAKDKERGGALGATMHASTLAGVDPSKPFLERWPGSEDAAHIATDALRKRSYAEARKIYTEVLDDQGRALFNKVRDAYSEQRADIQKALEQRIAESDADEATKKELMAALRQKFEAGRVQAPYFPLARFGDRWASAKDADGNTVSFSRFESKAEQGAWLDEMKAKGFKVDGGKRLDDKAQLERIDPQFVRKIAAMADKVNPELADEIFQEYLRSMPELSMRKNFIHRTGRLGYSMDALRAFAHQSFHGANQLARLEYGSRLDQHMADIKSEAQAVMSADPTGKNAQWASMLANEMDKRYEWIKNPKGSPLASKLTKLGFAWYLGAAPATAFRIFTQNPMLAFPALMKYHGSLGAVRELTRATAQYAKAKGMNGLENSLRGDERDAFVTGKNMGVFSSNASQNLANGGSGEPMYTGALYHVNHAAQYLFQAAEHYNRATTYLAAYRLGRMQDMTHEQAIDHAASVSFDAHFDYTNANRPRVLQNDLAKVAGLFRQYAFGVTYRVARDFNDGFLSFRDPGKFLGNSNDLSPQQRAQARAAFGGMMGMVWSFAGVKGLPLYWLAAGAYNAVMGDKDRPADMTYELHKYLNQHLGELAGDAVMTGPVGAISRAALSNGASYSDLWYKEPDRELTNGQYLTDALGQAAGPIFGILGNAAVGADMIHDGHVERGLEHFLPPSVAGPVKAARYALQGPKTLSGEPLLPGAPLTPCEIGLQAFGLTPQRVADVQSWKESNMNAKDIMEKRRVALINSFVAAQAAGNESEVGSALQDIQAWNDKNADIQGMPITNLYRSVLSHAKSEALSENGVKQMPGLTDTYGDYSGENHDGI